MQGQQFGGILPNQQQSPSDTLAQIQQRRLEQQRYQQQLQQQQQEHGDKMMQWAYSQLDPKDQLTGTVYDNVVTKTLTEGQQALAQKIMNNPNVSSAEVMIDVARLASDVSRYSVTAKNVRKGIEASVQEYAKDKSVNAGELLKQALGRAFMKPDPNDPSGRTQVMKSPDEINMGEDFVTPNLKYAINGDFAIKDFVSKIPLIDYERETQVTKGGVLNDVAYKGKYNQTFHQLIGPDGKPTDGNATPAARAVLRTKPVKLGDYEVEGVDDGIYNTLTANNPVIVASIQNYPEYKQYKKAFPDASEDDIAKVVLRQYLPAYVPGAINNTKTKVSDAQLQAHEWAKSNRLIAEAIKSGKTDNITWNNIYDVIDEKATANAKNNWYTRVNSLPPIAQEAVINWAKTMLGDSKEKPITQESIYITKADDGTLYLRDKATKRELAPLPKVDLNLKVNTGQKPRAAVIKDAKQQTPTPPSFKFVNGKTKF